MNMRVKPVCYSCDMRLVPAGISCPSSTVSELHQLQWSCIMWISIHSGGLPWAAEVVMVRSNKSRQTAQGSREKTLGTIKRIIPKTRKKTTWIRCRATWHSKKYWIVCKSAEFEKSEHQHSLLDKTRTSWDSFVIGMVSCRAFSVTIPPFGRWLPLPYRILHTNKVFAWMSMVKSVVFVCNLFFRNVYLRYITKSQVSLPYIPRSSSFHICCKIASSMHNPVYLHPVNQRSSMS